MKTPHKHAEVTIAWLNDQSIKLEFKRPYPVGEARWESNFGAMNPTTHPECEWRIKPEPKPDVVRYGIAMNFFGSLVAATSDNIKVTFDGETGKLIKAEVIS